MKKYCIFLFLFVSISVFSITAPDLSSRIEIDGFSNDFQNDEVMLVDSLGSFIEPDWDSYWGEFNDVEQIKVTWDSNYLYVAVDACSWDNNVILFLDVYDDYGLTEMNDLNTWKRSFFFYNQNPDFFLSTWDTNTNPQFWQMREGENLNADEIPDLEDYATFDTGNLDRSMEAAIPWELIYYEGNSGQRTMQNYPTIKFVTLITSGDDNTSGPDVAPDNLGGMSDDSSQLLVIDNYIEVTIDMDGDGLPDLNINPNDWDRIKYLEEPPISPIPLDIKKIKFLDGKVLYPYAESDFRIEITPNRDSQFFAEIYNIEGKFIKKLSNLSEYVFTWDGKNKNGKIVPFGFYFIRIKSDSNEISKVEAFSVIK